MTIYDETIGFFSEKTSMHGVRNAYEARSRPCRCLWASVTVCLTILAFFYGFQVCYVYLVKREPITSLSFLPQGHDGLPLPVVTICPSRNPFLLHRLHERNISYNAAAFLLLTVDQPGHISHVSSDTAEQLDSELRASLQHGETLYQLFNYLSPECEDMVASCFIYGERLSGSECCQQVFSGDYNVYYQGRCITTLHSTRLAAENQTIPGDYNGIGFILKDDSETFYAERDLRYSLVPAQEGNRLILTPHHTPPREAVYEQTFIVTVGAVTRLSIQLSVVDRSGEHISLLPFSEKTCMDIPPPGVQVAKTSCQDDVYQTAFRETCNCEHATMMESRENQRKANVCEPLAVISCQERWGEYNRQIPATQHCPVTCQKVIYQVVLDGSPIKRPMLDNFQFFGGSPAPVDSERNVTFSVVLVFYPTLVTHMIQLSKATLMEWLSDFGGQLSLFIGASVITMLEMLFFCVRVLTVIASRAFRPWLGRPRVGCLTSD